MSEPVVQTAVCHTNGRTKSDEMNMHFTKVFLQRTIVKYVKITSHL